jgi:aryl-alcohol dehydrogenase-like predicted oxidoreductase
VHAGGSFLDTANVYAYWTENGTGGESEALLGRWMQARGNRDKMFVATKVGFGVPQRVEEGLSAQTIIDECERSLRLLQTDTIDLFYAHRDDRNTPLEESLEAFDRLVQAGKVRFIGASNFLAWRIERARQISRARGWAEFCCVQQRHTYIRPKPGADLSPQLAVNDDLLDYARSEDFPIIAYSVLMGGFYARPEAGIPYQPDEYSRPDTEARMAVLHAVAAEVEATPSQVVLAWLMQGMPRMIPLIASGSPDRMQENLDARHITLTFEQIARLTDASA